MSQHTTAYCKNLGLVAALLVCFQLTDATLTYSTAAEAAVTKYLNNDDLAARLKDFQSRHEKIIRFENLTNSFGKHPVWAAELGSGGKEERAKRPAMLLVAGIEGNDLTGTSSAIRWMEDLAASYEGNGDAQKLLDTTTLYIFPRLNPDAAESFFAKPQQERSVNDDPSDDDNDGMVDEDGPDDLNGDGLITSMRIQDPEGDYIIDPNEPRLLMKADRAKGEVGAWRLFVEGKDDDHDERWNEDGRGGVNLNRNFPYNYQFFKPWSGKHQVSEPESRALADFIVYHPNIGIVFTFGEADNLIQTPESKDNPEGRKPPTYLRKEDLPYVRELGKKWRETLGLKKELKGTSAPGTFSDWMYYHRGRLSLAALPWSPAMQLQLEKDSAQAKKDEKKDKPEADQKSESKEEGKASSSKTPENQKPAGKEKSDGDNRNEEDRAFLKWLDEKYRDKYFLPWKEVQHPDFPSNRVEIGGFTPFAKSNPPEDLLESLTKKQSQFLTELAGKLPRIGIRKSEARHLGNSVFEITLQIVNTGYLPTVLAQGKTTQDVLPTRVALDLGKAELLTGTKTTLLGPLEGSGSMNELRYTLYAKGEDKIRVSVVSALAGSVETNIELKEKN